MKAQTLLQLSNKGYNIPIFFVLPETYFTQILNNHLSQMYEQFGNIEMHVDKVSTEKKSLLIDSPTWS